MVGRLQEKVALVVGAGSVGPGWGNGKATAVLFAREGAKVLCADVNGDAANETVQIIRQENGTANAIRADVTSHNDIRRMVKACTDVYGRLDVVDYNVGLAHVSSSPGLNEFARDPVGNTSYGAPIRVHVVADRGLPRRRDCGCGAAGISAATGSGSSREALRPRPKPSCLASPDRRSE
jgi:NAD(P)-dependent dehydrogenase (short-subunit alcohol dehydrogenase family)